MTTLFGDIPSAPLYHLPRPDALSGLVAKVLGDAGPVGVTGRAIGVGLEGMGGIGKTTLAADLCREPTVAAAFPGGIFWITLGETPDVAQAQQRLARWIGGAPVALRDTAEGRDRLTALLADHAARGLIVLDDLWELAHVRELLPASVGGHRLLFTTRRGDLLRTLGAEEHRVEEMTPSAARALLAACARRPEDRLPAPADAIIHECGRLPLALAIVGALLADQDAACWDEVLAALRRADHNDLDTELPDYTRSRHVFGALAVSVNRLELEERDRFADLAVFPEDTAIPAAVFERLWPNETSLKRSRRLALFVDRNLARRTADGRVTLHDLQRDYLVGALAKDTLPKRHRTLVDGYRAACRGVWRDCRTTAMSSAGCPGICARRGRRTNCAACCSTRPGWPPNCEPSAPPPWKPTIPCCRATPKPGWSAARCACPPMCWRRIPINWPASCGDASRPIRAQGSPPCWTRRATNMRQTHG